MEELNFGTTITQQDENGLEIYVRYHKPKYKTLSPRVESLNNFISEAHKVTPNYYKKYYHDWIAALKGVKSIEKIKRKAFVTIVTKRADFLDKVNRYGGAKPIEDILVKKGWIYDDRDEFCELSVLQGKSTRKQQFTYIKVQYI